VATEAAWLNGNNLEKEEIKKKEDLTLTGLLMEGLKRRFISWMPSYRVIFVAGTDPKSACTVRRMGFVPATGKCIFQKLISAGTNSNATFLLPSRTGFADTTLHSAFCPLLILINISFCPIFTSGSSAIIPPCLLTESVRAWALNFPLLSVSPWTMRSTLNATRDVRRRSMLRKCCVPMAARTSRVG